MMEWKSFKDEEPEYNKDVWVSDFKSVWLCSIDEVACWKGYINENHDRKEFYWKYVDVPEVPKKPKIITHSCSFKTSFEDGGCYETSTGLWVGIGRTSIEFKVNFCPVCGYSIPKEKDYINQRCC